MISYSIEEYSNKFASNNNVAWLQENNELQLLLDKLLKLPMTKTKQSLMVRKRAPSRIWHQQRHVVERKGTQLAYYRKDETMVANYPITNWNEREATNKDIKYPMAGNDKRECYFGNFRCSFGKK